MTTESMLLSLERTSRVSAILMALGAIVVACALWLATSRLVAIQSEVTELEARSQALQLRNRDLERVTSELTTTSATLRKEISGLRQALLASRNAIAAFHARNYSAAVTLYDTAIAADPGNAYLMNLRAYALFKQGKLAEAISAQQLGVRTDPAYVWGLFDLARFQCAAGDKAAAAKSLGEAIAKDNRFESLADQDGEFRHLCGSLIGR